MPTDAVMIKTEQNEQNVPAAAVAARKSEVNTCLFVCLFLFPAKSRLFYLGEKLSPDAALPWFPNTELNQPKRFLTASFLVI